MSQYTQAKCVLHCLEIAAVHFEAGIVLGGWSPRSGRIMATAYAKSDSRQATSVQPIGGQFASQGDPLKGVAPKHAVGRPDGRRAAPSGLPQ